jgi:sugar phosphate isomerase/epimerase
MQLKLIKCDWGLEHLGDQRERLRRYAEAGWDGIECALVTMDPVEFGERCGELGLDYVAMMFCDDEEAFRKWWKVIQRTRPILINCHPGRDRYDFARGLTFFREVMAMACDAGVQVVYETHRTRLLYAPWTTARYLEALPDLRLTADFSHFTAVAESDLSQPGYRELMDAAIARTDHVHARVGHAHGPQVADPRVGAGLEWTQRFEAWWDRIVEQRLAEGRPFLTVNPEFGPPPYQPTDPAGRPLADLWDVCNWMAQRLRDRWRDRLEASTPVVPRRTSA